MRRLLVVDDDPDLAGLLSTFLERHGYAVEVRGHGHGLEDIVAAGDAAPDLLLLDVMLPGRDGFTLCRDLRERGLSVPIVMLTGRGDDLDRIRGLRLGADDYLPKPFNPHELLARIEAVLRRTASPASVAVHPAPDAPQGNRFEGDERTLWLEGRSYVLTPTEARLIEVMTASPGRTFTRDQLLDALDVAGAHDVFDRAIDVQISRLRAKIEDNPRRPRHLHTVRGLGYRFTW
ncbi:MAG: response regulator transcription factor [Candidatus Sericytochromatia bacterium]|nr:response regulator transcription factor [Candidatus Sericytochromatia bacterium]